MPSDPQQALQGCQCAKHPEMDRDEPPETIQKELSGADLCIGLLGSCTLYIASLGSCHPRLWLSVLPVLLQERSPEHQPGSVQHHTG